MNTHVIGPNVIPSIIHSLWLAMAVLLVALLIFQASANALPAPTSQQFITPYTAIVSPVVNAAAVASQPIALGGSAVGSGDLLIQVKTGSLDVAMDAYFAIVANNLAPGEIFLLNAIGGLQAFNGELIP